MPVYGVGRSNRINRIEYVGQTTAGFSVMLSAAASGATGGLFGRTLIARYCHYILTFTYLLYVYIGTDPFPSAEFAARADGNPLDRLILLGMTALSLLVLLLHRETIPSIALRGAGIWIVVAIAICSVLWSNYPGLTIRRSFAMACIVIITAGVAAGVRDLRSAHTAFCIAITAIVLINLIATVLLPAAAISDIGVKGIYSQKNVAGTVAMTAVIANASWLARGHTTRNHVILGAAMLAASLAFLLITKSKTSIGLTLLALIVMGALVVIAKSGPRLAMVALLMAMTGLGLFLIILAVNDFDPLAVLSLVLSDTSFTGRDELWAFAYRVAQERSWLGHGYGAFWDVGIGGDPLLRMEPGGWLGDVEPGVINQAHNGYLELWLQIGLPATILSTLVIVGLTIKGSYLWATSKAPKGTRAAIAFITVMPVIFLLHNLTEASLFIRGIILCNTLFPILFLLVRLHELAGGPTDIAYDRLR